MATWEEAYRGIFPQIDADDFAITSPRNPVYNCIAWAAAEDDIWWWPDNDNYWPDGLPKNDSVQNFIDAFGTLGYVPCTNGNFEEGFEKVVIYAEGGRAKHMARQLPNGKWTSKLGREHDVSHGQDWHLSGKDYGQCVQYLRRSIGRQ
ncbi:hypothetical protein [Burkholderia ubonensis]|uniref:DUF7689 domain-containing protein n=1 Tax=Burkholderia ubonensis TaxID=101571 RepID=UPI000AAE6E2B|nr:hypothetical protein [Burkholderia ubonensis]